MISSLQRLAFLSLQAGSYLRHLHTPAALLARLYIANVFFSAGLTKVADWDTTLFLFAEEYSVPLLPAGLAALLGTFGELLFPLLLALGIATRFSTLALSVVNIVAVISLSDIPPAALYLHVIWGLLLVQLLIYGPGQLTAGRVYRWLRKSPDQAGMQY